MARVVKFFKTIRNNWKKSVVFTGIAAYGVKYGNGLYIDSGIRREYCLEAKTYGEEPLRTDQIPRRVTVFLNPAARKGKARKVFEKTAGPILYLAGLQVTVVKTEYAGQAKKYMEVIDDVDAIVVAGGDGTFNEVVTGLLRREDSDKLSKIPVGFIPLGYTNTLAQRLFDSGRSDCNMMAEAAIAVVRNVYKPSDVMKIQGEEGKPVFAVNALEWGAYKDAGFRCEKYWYFGPLKRKWSYIKPTFKSWPPAFNVQLSYVFPCEGCSKCYTAPPEPQWKWWHIFMPPRREVPKKDYSMITNEECGVVHSEDINTVELRASVSDESEITTGGALAIEPSDISKTDFIKEGWRRHVEPSDSQLSLKKIVKEFKLTPVIEEIENEKQMDKHYIIDNEEFEIKPITVEFLKDRINFFCSKSKLKVA